MDNLNHIDRQDRKILDILSREGRLPITDLAKRVGLSKSPCQVRVKRLQKDGYIKGFRAIIDPAKMRLEQVAFVEVKLSDTSEVSVVSVQRRGATPARS